MSPNINNRYYNTCARLTSSKAGLNLNLGAAVAGIFSGSKKKKSDVDADGSSSTYEHTQGRGYVEGSGVGNLGAIANGQASVADRQRRTVEGTQQQIDHLGLGEQKSIKAAQK